MYVTGVKIAVKSIDYTFDGLTILRTLFFLLPYNVTTSLDMLLRKMVGGKHMKRDIETGCCQNSSEKLKEDTESDEFS